MVAERTWCQFEHPHYRQRAETGEHGHYLGQETGCLDWKEGTLKHRGIHCSQRPHLSNQFAGTTHAFGMCDMLSPPRGGWSSCSLGRVKSLPHSQLIDYSCLHKQIDLLPTQKSTLLLGRPESERAPPKQPTGGGAESRCRAENKQGFTLVQAHDSAEIHRQPRQVWPWALSKLSWAVSHSSLRWSNSSSAVSRGNCTPNATFGNRFPGPATGPPSSFWLEPWELCFLLQQALKWDLIRPPLHKINHRVDVCVVFLAYLLFWGHFSLVIFIQISSWKGPVLYAYPLPLCYHPSSPDLLASSLPPQWKLRVLTTAPLGTSLILAF